MGGCLGVILMFILVALFMTYPIPAIVVTAISIVIIIVYVKEDRVDREKKLKLEKESSERAKQLYNEARSKVTIPENALKVRYKKGYIKLLYSNYMWIENNNLCFFPAYAPNTDTPDNIEKIILHKIPIDKIEYYSIQGEIIHENKITGGSGGGSSVQGAIVGGIIAGEAGAIIGSRKKIDPIKSELIKHDNRETFLNFFDDNNVKYSMIFDFKSYSAFNELLPEKAFEIVNTIKTNSIINKSLEENNLKNITDQIRELAKLKEEGIITDEEFSQKKRLLLEKIG